MTLGLRRETTRRERTAGGGPSRSQLRATGAGSACAQGRLTVYLGAASRGPADGPRPERARSSPRGGARRGRWGCRPAGQTCLSTASAGQSNFSRGTEEVRNTMLSHCAEAVAESRRVGVGSDRGRSRRAWVGAVDASALPAAPGSGGGLLIVCDARSGWRRGWIVRRAAPTIVAIAGTKRGEVHLGDGVEHEPRQVPLGPPFAQARRQQPLLL